MSEGAISTAKRKGRERAKWWKFGESLKEQIYTPFVFRDLVHDGLDLTINKSSVTLSPLHMRKLVTR